MVDYAWQMTQFKRRQRAERYYMGADGFARIRFNGPLVRIARIYTGDGGELKADVRTLSGQRTIDACLLMPEDRYDVVEALGLING